MKRNIEYAAISLLAAFLVALTCAICEVAARSVAKQNISEAVKSDFFTFFHFEEGDKKELPDGKSMLAYHTGVGGHSVNLGVELDKQRNITNMILILPKAFVDDPKYKHFAADIAKSFLKAAVPDVDAPAIEDLTNDIMFRGGTWSATKADTKQVETGEQQKDATLLKEGKGAPKVGESVWIGSADAPKLKEKPSPGFLAYVGEQKDFEMKLPDSSELTISNAEENGQKRVLLVVRTH